MLNKYSDTIHYDLETNEWMVKDIYNNKHRINDGIELKSYMDIITDIYTNYNYKQLNKYVR